MNRWCRFLRLSFVDQWLLVKAMFLLGAITLGLKLLSFQTLRRLVTSEVRPRTGLPEQDRPAAERIAWAVRVAGRYVPATTCLSQALTVQRLIKSHGYPARLYIGVAKNETGQLEAHAWVESQDKIIIGGLQDLAHYTPLPPLEGEKA